MAHAKRHTGDPNKGTGLTEDSEVEYHAAIYAMDETAARWAQQIYSLRLDNMSITREAPSPQAGSY